VLCSVMRIRASFHGFHSPVLIKITRGLASREPMGRACHTPKREESSFLVCWRQVCLHCCHEHRRAMPASYQLPSRFQRHDMSLQGTCFTAVTEDMMIKTGLFTTMGRRFPVLPSSTELLNNSPSLQDLRFLFSNPVHCQKNPQHVPELVRTLASPWMTGREPPISQNCTASVGDKLALAGSRNRPLRRETDDCSELDDMSTSHHQASVKHPSGGLGLPRQPPQRGTVHSTHGRGSCTSMGRLMAQCATQPSQRSVCMGQGVHV